MLLDIHRSNKFTHTFQVGVVKHAIDVPKAMSNIGSALFQE